MLGHKHVVAEVRAATAASHRRTWHPDPAGVAVRLKYVGVFVILVDTAQFSFAFHWPEWVCASFIRDPSSTHRAAEMPGAADWNESAASSGSAGFLPQEVGNWDGVFPKPGKIGREIHGKNEKYKGSSAVQVREISFPLACMLATAGVLCHSLLLLVLSTARLSPGSKVYLKFPPLFSSVAVLIAVEGRQVPKYCFVDWTLCNNSCKLLTSGFSFLKGKLCKYYP